MSAHTTKRTMRLLVISAVALWSCARDAAPSRPLGEDLYRDGQHYFVPVAGFVPDSITAVRLAEVVLEPVYGRQTIVRERPFDAELQDSVWVVEGHLPKGSTVGGTAMLVISRRDGRILRMTHGE